MSVANSEKALILDFGGVVTRTLFETHDITERALGLPAGTLTRRRTNRWHSGKAM